MITVGRRTAVVGFVRPGKERELVSITTTSNLVTSNVVKVFLLNVYIREELLNVIYILDDFENAFNMTGTDGRL